MKKLTVCVLCLLCLLCLCTACTTKTESEKFAEAKEFAKRAELDSLVEGTSKEFIDEYKLVVREFLMEKGVTVKDDFMVAAIYNSALENYQLRYECLTESGEYLQYKMDIDDKYQIVNALLTGKLYRSIDGTYYFADLNFCEMIDYDTSNWVLVDDVIMEQK